MYIYNITVLQYHCHHCYYFITSFVNASAPTAESGATAGAVGSEVEEPIHELREVATSSPHEALCIADDVEEVESEYAVMQGETVRTVHLHARETETMLSLTNDPSHSRDHSQDWIPQSGILGASLR